MMFKRWLRRDRPAPARRVAPHAEWLEPRLLFSADLPAGWLSAPVTPQDQGGPHAVGAGRVRARRAAAVAGRSLRHHFAQFREERRPARRDIDFIATGSGYTVAFSDGNADIVLAGAKAPVHLEIVGGRDDVRPGARACSTRAATTCWAATRASG
ncbi:LEPR-XLL domain-containing protein [Ramlibacter terrae]|uniref:LEPR-XLL domain-containing protein n=1 Tax=Ramlibacter terrae TaxID=2732511 RepID=A0ABX6P5R4_9BURK|nr:LEPR-XLL domain-containing protein [Ramlibacter terrae]